MTIESKIGMFVRAGVVLGALALSAACEQPVQEGQSALQACNQPVRQPYDPCGGKSCGDPCTLCDPTDPDCAETAVLKYCDARGACGPELPQCSPSSSCGKGLEWCTLNGRCVDPACLSCCQFGIVCRTESDCGDAPCVICPDGSAECSKPQCGGDVPDQCFFPHPACR